MSRAEYTKNGKTKEELIQEILEAVATGRTINGYLKENERFMPTERTFYRWLLDDEELCQRLARARSIQADVFADEVLNIVDRVKDETYNPAQARAIIYGFERAHMMRKPKTLKITGHDGGALFGDVPRDRAREILALATKELEKEEEDEN